MHTMQYLKQASMPSVSICIGALRSRLLFGTVSGAKVDSIIAKKMTGDHSAVRGGLPRHFRTGHPHGSSWCKRSFRFF